MTGLFTCEAVGVRLGGREILAGVDVDIPQSGITVLAGPSGAGKSTLLRLFNRLEVPTTGVVRHLGEDVATIPARRLRRRVGMVFQRPVPFGGSVADNLRVAAPDAGHDRLGASLDEVGLAADRLADEAATLSGGEAQRMCIARALLTGPDCLLMDEPTSSLDPVARSGIESLAATLAHDGVPVVWVTHDLEQMRRIAGHVLVLVGGCLRFAGSPDDLAATVDEQVAAFVRGDAGLGGTA